MKAKNYINQKLVPQNLHTLTSNTISPEKDPIEDLANKNTLPFQKTFSNSTFQNPLSRKQTIDNESAQFQEIEEVLEKQQLQQFANAVFQCAYCKKILFNSFQIDSILKVKQCIGKTNFSYSFYYLFESQYLTDQLITNGSFKYNNDQFDSLCAFQEFLCSNCKGLAIGRVYESAPKEKEILIEKVSVKSSDLLMYQIGNGIVMEQDEYLSSFFTMVDLPRRPSYKFSDSLEMQSQKEIKVNQNIELLNINKQLKSDKSEQLRINHYDSKKQEKTSKELKQKLIRAIEDVKLIDKRLKQNEYENKKYISKLFKN